ncbi:HAD-like protein [Fistulina hepatica ATCC 64428]|uniref:HAD-like protein n=1 Tax=Fistulina hepatica ATCC 64428 TaxID=1128425 RepID=A0A0D7AQ09_9AGAR|nr:HAD-like protein [Fistulina hepatica ATCC 64428]
MTSRIRLVTFDAVHTLIKARVPFNVQYANAFRPYLGEVDPDAVRVSFKKALRRAQQNNPLFDKGSQAWWGEVIRETAIGAGADAQAVDKHSPAIVSRLWHIFSSKEGYQAFDDAIPATHELHRMGVRTAVISNSDARVRSAIRDVGFPETLYPIILSEEEHVAKPTAEIFLRTIRLAGGFRPEECVHIGDSYKQDYLGAQYAGMHALLLRRPGPDGQDAEIEDGEDLRHVNVVRDLHEATKWVAARNRE